MRDFNGTVEVDGKVYGETDVREAVAVIRDCQSILADYLPPDGIDAQTALNRLLAILDGPRGLKVAPPLHSAA